MDDSITQVWTDSLGEASKTLTIFLSDRQNLSKCTELSKLMIATYRAGGNVFSCGNGGSHCDAMHFAEEMTGRYRKDRRALGALALGDPSHVTCVGNDYGFEEIFARQLQGLGRSGDLLIGLSTSGNSENVCKAVKAARAMGITSFALLGKDGGRLLSLADHSIVIPAKTPDRIQEMHIKLLHCVIETVEREIFPENYV